MKTKRILTRSGTTFGTLKFYEKSCFNTILQFAPDWFYQHTNAIHADSSGVYSNDKFLNLGTIDQIHLKCDVIDGSVVNGLRKPILFSFVLDKSSGYRVFCEPETKRFKKIKKTCFEY